MMKLPTNQRSLLNSDASILAEIWNSLRKYEAIRALDMDSFSVTVENASVLLMGHVSKRYHHDLIEETARSLPSVTAVCNKLVVDSDLTVQVARSLSSDERIRGFIIPVGCVHGWMRLGGEVSSRELQLAAENIAVQVPNVRGVLSRPRVIGESPEAERQALQPHMNTMIYDYSRQEGVVTQVVIQPRDHLVTHVVVSMSGFHDGEFVVRERLIPVEAMEVVHKESIFLKRKGPPLNAFPAFDPSDYPLAPLDWQPPYPYVAGEVRWPCYQRK